VSWGGEIREIEEIGEEVRTTFPILPIFHTLPHSTPNTYHPTPNFC
jgi:hypothetical protein